MRSKYWMAFAAVVLLGTQNVAPVAAPPAPGSQGPRSRAVDDAFAVALVQGDDAELRAASLALARTHSDDVAAFARQMIVDHGAIAAEGKTLLGAYHVEGIAKLGAPDELGVANLERLTPVDFDRNYALLQIGDHLATETAFATEARDGADPALAAFARKWLPTIQAHLQLADTLVKHVGGDTPFR